MGAFHPHTEGEVQMPKSDLTSHAGKASTGVA
jgi:hypothetical protein